MRILREFLDALEELLAAEVLLALALVLFEHLLHFGLRGDGGMVRARKPERALALHAGVAGHDVLDDEHESVAGVERSGDVRRGKHYGKGLCVSRSEALFDAHVRVEEPACFPGGIDARLGLGRAIRLEQLLRSVLDVHS